MLELAQQVGNMGHFVVDVATERVTWSPQMFRLHEMSPDEETPDIGLKYVPPDDAARLRETLRAIGPGQQPSVEHWLITKSGKKRQVLTTMKMVYDEQGKARTLLGTMLDISRLKQAEEGIRNYAERLAIFNEIGQSVATQRNLADVLEAIAIHLQRVVQLDAFFVALYDPATGLLTYPIVYDGGTRYTQESQPLTARSTSSRVIQSGKAILTNRTPEQIASTANGGVGDARRISASLIHVPLVVEDRTVGVLSAQSYTSNAYDESHVALMMGIANQTAVAIRNAQLFEAQQQELAERRTAERRLALQNEIGRIITSVHNLDEVLERILQSVAQCMPVDAFFVALYDQPHNQLTYPLLFDSGKRFTRAPEALTPGSATWRTIVEDRRILILRTPEQVASARSERFGEDRASASLIYVPMNVEGRVLGAISAQSYLVGAYDEGHVALLSGVADQAAIAIRNAQLFAEANQELAERRTAEERLESLSEISRAISTVRGLSEVLDIIDQQVRRMIPHDVFYVALFDESEGSVSYPIYRDDGKRRPREPAILSGESLFDRVLRQGEAILLNRTRAEVETAPELQSGAAGRAAASLLFAPLHGTLRVVGLISIQSYTPHQYDEQDLDLLKGVAYQTEIAIESARLLHALGAELGQRRRAEVERERLISELEDRNKELEQFTYTVSHDLKSPLITVLGFLGYLAEDAASGNQVRLSQDIQRIVDATNRMQRLLDELLALSRVGRQLNKTEDVPSETIVNESLALVRGRLKAGRVEVHVQTGLPIVHGDSVRLVEVMQNLLDNAAKFMGDQPSPCIEIGTRLGSDGLTVFTVSDNGIGIEPQHLLRVFGLFDKLDPRTEGTGVGLALAKRIIDVHGGRIWVESDGFRRGSTFCFTLPEALLPAPARG